MEKGLNLSILDGIPAIEQDSVSEAERISIPSELPNLDFEEQEKVDSGDVPQPGAEVTDTDDSDDSGFDEPDESGNLDDTSDDNTSLNKVWVEWAADMGLLKVEEGEVVEDSDEYLINKFNARIDEGINSKLENLPEDLKYLIANYTEGDDIRKYMQSESRVIEYSNIDPAALSENIDAQKELVATDLRNRGLAEESIQSRLDKLEEADILEDEAHLALSALTKVEEANKLNIRKQVEIQRQTEQAQVQKVYDDLKTSIMAKTEILPGIAVTEAQKKALVDLITKPIARDSYGNPISGLNKLQMSDPNFLEKVAYVAGILNWDMGTITRSANTKSTLKLKNRVDGVYTNDSKLKGIDIKTLKQGMRRYRNNNSFLKK